MLHLSFPDHLAMPHPYVHLSSRNVFGSSICFRFAFECAPSIMPNVQHSDVSRNQLFSICISWRRFGNMREMSRGKLRACRTRQRHFFRSLHQQFTGSNSSTLAPLQLIFLMDMFTDEVGKVLGYDFRALAVINFGFRWTSQLSLLMGTSRYLYLSYRSGGVYHNVNNVNKW